jgi:PPP family 3-phenylpropionic acid transporter
VVVRPPFSAPSAASISTRLAVFYAAIFAAVGVAVPFWPVWLDSRGLGAEEIGIVLAAERWVRIFTMPLIARLVDRGAPIRGVMILLALATFAGTAAFEWASALGVYVALSIATGISVSPLVPLGDTLTVEEGKRANVDYGRVRLWGSVAFIGASVGAGQLLASEPPSLILWLLVLGFGATVLATIGLPRGARDRDREKRAHRGRTLALLRHPTFLLFLAATGLSQASHAVYYGFGSLHWSRAGHSETVIGMLWAEGVIAEVLLFVVGRRLTDRFRPAVLIGLGGLAGALRWTVLAETTSLPWLVAAQLLHALTFGAVHLGAMAFLARRMPAALAATGQSLYSATTAGLALGAATPVAAALFETHRGGAYLFGVALSSAAIVFAVLLRRAPDLDVGD